MSVASLKYSRLSIDTLGAFTNSFAIVVIMLLIVVVLKKPPRGTIANECTATIYTVYVVKERVRGPAVCRYATGRHGVAVVVGDD